jgi:hypothetical protein
MWQRGIGAATAAVAAPAGDEDFEKQRTAVGATATTGEIDEQMARSLIADIDLRQAASHTFKESCLRRLFGCARREQGATMRGWL